MSAITADMIRAAVKARADEIIAWTKVLISFPSENRPPDGTEEAAQRFIAAECRKLGLELDVFSPEEVPDIQKHPAWLAGRKYDNGRKNVVARWQGGRGEQARAALRARSARKVQVARREDYAGGGKSVLFSGHVDVAPFEPDNWKECEPYEPVVKDGRLYGRGAADMKGGQAAAFWALRILQDLGFEPGGDILFESLVDEEFAGGNGTLAARLRGHNADLAIVGEPTRMEVCPACFGAFLGNFTLSGKAGMPFMGTAIANPIVGAARAIRFFEEWQERWRAQNHHPMFTDPGKELNCLLWKIDSTTPGEFTQMGTPLLTKISWIVWCHPGMTEDEFYRRFRAFWKERAAAEPALAPFEMKIEPDFHFVKPWETPATDPAVQAAVKAFGEYQGSAPKVGGAPFSCDLAHYGETGRMPAVLLGPRGDNLHAPDEWVPIEDILSLTGIYATLAARWCGG